MKRAVLYLLAVWERKKSIDRETDRILIGRLEAAGYRVVRASTMAWMHTLLCLRPFHAAIISRRFADAHRLSPERHLRESDSEHIILVWDRDETGTVTCRTFQNPQYATPTNPLMPNFLEAGTAVARALVTPRDCEAARATESVAAGGEHSRRERPWTRDEADDARHSPDMHRKQALVLDAIASGGSRGTDVATIERRVWGTDAGTRKKDIQIYVSKLRRYLSSREGARCTIAYRDRRYYLTGLR